MEPLSESNFYRARRMANEAILTINLQYRRLNSDEPEDNYFAFRKWADIHFFLIALLKLKKSALIALTIKEISPCIQKAINNFDRKLPRIQTMRNVLEHINPLFNWKRK